MKMKKEETNQTIQPKDTKQHGSLLQESFEQLRDKKYADIRIKMGLKQYAQYKQDGASPLRADNLLEKSLGFGSNASSGNTSPLKDVYLPPEISENHWGEINKLAYQEHLDQKRKQKEIKLKQRMDLKQALERQLQDQKMQRYRLKQREEELDKEYLQKAQ